MKYIRTIRIQIGKNDWELEIYCGWLLTMKENRWETGSVGVNITARMTSLSTLN